MMPEDDMDDIEEGLDIDDSPTDDSQYMTMAGMPSHTDMQTGLPTHIDMRSLSREPMGPSPGMVAASGFE